MWWVTAIQWDGTTFLSKCLLRAQGSLYILTEVLLRVEGHRPLHRLSIWAIVFLGWCLELQVVDADNHNSVHVISNFKALQHYLSDISSAAAMVENLRKDHSEECTTLWPPSVPATAPVSSKWYISIPQIHFLRPHKTMLKMCLNYGKQCARLQRKCGLDIHNVLPQLVFTLSS